MKIGEDMPKLKADRTQLMRLFQNLMENLQTLKLDLNNIPYVIQYNKRDLPNALPVADLRAALNKYNAPDFEAVASQGKGVMEAFKTVSRAIITVLKGGEL